MWKNRIERERYIRAYENIVIKEREKEDSSLCRRGREKGRKKETESSRYVLTKKKESKYRTQKDKRRKKKEKKIR